tara:strand:- start:1480 stop:2067 length:588 start_codon:yes stop_codon:yes gene_type:complete
MSLANNAAPFNEDEPGDLMNKKKSHNRTQRNTNNNYNDKVSNMIQAIHSNPSNDDDTQLGDFYPPPKPESSGVEKTKMETTHHVDFKRENIPKPLDKEDQINTQSYASNNTPTNSVDDFYKISPHSTTARSYYNESTNESSELLTKKLNYMIHLLEEQQDERTGYVTEEVIMYSFLGIFIIFIVDSFVRVGKYVR